MRHGIRLLGTTTIALRVAWWAGVTVVAGLGGVAALFVVPPAALVLMGGFAAGASVLPWLPPTAPAHAGTTAACRGHVAVAAGAAAAACVVAVGVVSITGFSGLALLALLVATSPPARRRYRRYVPLLDVHPGGDGPLEPPGRTASPPPVLTLPWPATSLTTEQLCWAWRRSFTTLQRARTPAQRAAAAAVRAGYLDELERRDPAGFTAWLANGPRPASNPARYLRVVAGLPTLAADDRRTAQQLPTGSAGNPPTEHDTAEHPRTDDR